MKRSLKLLLLGSLFLIHVLTGTNVYAQKEAYNWYFGAHVGMTWNTTQTIVHNGKILSGMPTPLPSSMMTDTPHGPFCISDTYGNLLFYSDGITIWNREHNVMTNGDGLYGGNFSLQSIVIPYPSQPDKYIVFSTSGSSNYTFSYSIVDMTASGGLGAVTAEKNIFLTGGSGTHSTSISAVLHTNGVDYWIIAIGKGNLDEGKSALNVWEVTTSGVNTVCYASYPLTANTTPTNNGGHLRFSANGKYFAWTEDYSYGGLDPLYFGEFDPSTGAFPTVKRMNGGFGGFGVEFSPSSKILYRSDYGSAAGNIRAYKFADMLASSDPENMNYRVLNPQVVYPNRTRALQLAPDGRIYGTIVTVMDNTSMMVIDNVDDYDNFTVHLINSGLLPTGTGHHVGTGLPNFMSHFVAPAGYDTTTCLGETATLTASLKTSGSVINPVYKWYNAINGGTLLHTGSIFTTTTALMTDTAFYVSLEGDNYCEGPRLPIYITVEPCSKVVDDSTTTVVNINDTIPVLDNDTYPSSCEPGIVPVVTAGPFVPGASYAIAGKNIVYIPAPDFIGEDSIKYKLSCGGNSGATVYINVIPVPVKKEATLLLSPPFRHNGTYPNPVSVLYGEDVEYKITAVNINKNTAHVIIRDTLPPYMAFKSTSPSITPGSNGGTPPRTTLEWDMYPVSYMDTTTVSYVATPQSGASASQPLFINKAWVTIGGITMPTNSTYHQGAGISIMTFSAGLGGNLYNAREQVLDYMTTPKSGIVIAPEDGYQFTGWSHGDYTSLRGATIAAQEGIMLYDTLTVYGDVELHANFELEEYPIRYYLNGSENVSANPEKYTIKSGAIGLKAPQKAGDTFVGWTGSNGDEPQQSVVIANGTTGELRFYANFLLSGREEAKPETAIGDDKVWAVNGELYIRTTKAGSIVRIYSLDGILRELYTIVSPGVATRKFPRGIYIVTINNNIGQKIRIE